MLKMKATLIPGRVRGQMFSVEGFQQIQDLGPQVKLADPETGRPQKLICCFFRGKNMGTIVVLTNAIPDLIKETPVPQDVTSSVHISFFNHPDEVVSRVETFVDTLQDCYIYENEDDIAMHKHSMIEHILNNETAYICI